MYLGLFLPAHFQITLCNWWCLSWWQYIVWCQKNWSQNLTSWKSSFSASVGRTHTMLHICHIKSRATPKIQIRPLKCMQVAGPVFCWNFPGCSRVTFNSLITQWGYFVFNFLCSFWQFPHFLWIKKAFPSRLKLWQTYHVLKSDN